MSIVVDTCKWFCGDCGGCRANACPTLFGGNPEVPCGHGEGPNGTDWYASKSPVAVTE